MSSRRPRTPQRAWRPLAALTALALLAGFAAPAAAARHPAQTPIRIADADEDVEYKVAPPGVKVMELRSMVPYSTEGMSLPTETEPNDDFTTANPLAGSQAVILGNISPPAEADYFSFSALAGDRVYAATMSSFSNSGSTDTELTLYASDGTTVIEFDDDSGTFSTLSSVIGGATIPADGTYYVGVVGASTITPITPYHLHVRVQSGSPGLEVEPNNTPAAANPLVNGWATGNISATTDPDVFSIDLVAGDSIAVTLDMDPERAPANTNWNGRLWIGLFNGVNQPVVNDASTVKPHAEALFLTVRDAGTYYVTVDSASTTGLGADARYTLNVTVLPRQVQTDCSVIASTNVPVAIGPGAGTVTSTIVVPHGVTIALNDVNVLLDITHAAPADLDLELIAPSATATPLFSDIGTTTQPAIAVWLDDNAALPPVSPFNVLNGVVFQPEQPGRLASFNGQPPTGTWTLSITDDLTNTSGGTLNGWSLEVCGPPTPPYGLSLTKTVGFEPGVCATESEVTVAPGATVYYCYTATNLGLNPLATHDLVDDQLGTIFTGQAFALAPGASVSTVDLGLTISAVITSTVTNNATWTGHDGGNNASASASATVNVLPERCGAGSTEVTLAVSDFAGAFPPTGWTVTNTSSGCGAGGVPEWTNTNPGDLGNLSGGTGSFAVADSDACGSGSTLDTILLTPVLDLTGLENAAVQFYMDYNDLGTGGDTALLDVSTDGGATWTNVQTWDADFRGPLLISLPIPGAGENDVQVRWHYAQGTFDWWWEIDDAMVTACTPAVVPEITLAKTVGTVPATCAATDTITVNTGTDVYYCYTVENTGSVAFNFHDLDDDVLGVLLDDFPYALDPGAAAEVIVADVAMAPVTNTATWTASTALPGYTVDDTIPYDFVDISGTGTAFALGDDEVSAALPIGFTFNYFGSDYADSYASSNGFLTLLAGQSNGCCSGQPMPTPGDPDAVIAGWWEDLDPGEAGAGLYFQTLGSAPNRVFVVQFTNVQHWPSGTPVTFQYKLFEGSNAIEVHYQSAPSDGGTHSAGIEDAAGTAGNQYFLGSTGLPTPIAVRYAVAAPPMTASATDTATVNIADPDIVVTPAELSSIQPVDTQVVETLDIGNVGVADLLWTITEDAGLWGGRMIAALPGRQEPIRAHDRDALPAPAVDLGRGEHSYSRASEGTAGQSVTPVRGEAPDATVTITHSATQNIVSLNSVSCNAGGLHTDNSYIRRFTLTDFGINGNYAVTQVEVGIEQATGAGGSQPATVNLYTWNPADPFTFANFVPIGTANATVPDQSLTIITVPVTGLAPAGSTLVVEFFTPNGQVAGNSLFVGSNPDGQTSPTFLAAADCGVPEPTDTAVIGFPGMHLVMNVTGTTGCDADLPWVSSSPAAGTTLPGTNDTVNVTFDSTGLAPGAVYTGSLCVQSNDPDSPEILVPLTLEVGGMPFIADFEEGDFSEWTSVQP